MLPVSITKSKPRSSAVPSGSALIAVVAGFCSAIGYTAANICLRSVPESDSVWVSCVKALPLVALVAPVLAWRACRGQRILAGRKVMFELVLASLFGQLAGNVAFQFSLGAIGLALTVACVFGAMISSGIFIGHFVLGERVVLRMIAASGVLIVAIGILSAGAGEANRRMSAARKVLSPAVGSEFASAGGSASLDSDAPPWLAIGGVLAACSAGIAYSVLGAAIRRTSAAGMPQQTILFAVGMAGVLFLGPLSLSRLGLSGILATTPRELAFMLGAGLCNAFAFCALTIALRRSGLVLVNALNASQVAMAAMAGVFLFAEPLTWPLAAGVTLTVTGLLSLRRWSSWRWRHGSPLAFKPERPRAASEKEALRPAEETPHRDEVPCSEA